METLESLEATDTRISKTEDTNGKSRMRIVGVLLFGFVTFVFFLLMKLPEARIQNLVIAHARIIAQQQGLLFSAEKVRLSMFPGPALKMYNVELRSIDNDRHVLKIPYLRARPQLLSLLGRTKKAAISAEMLDGELSGVVGASPTTLAVDLELDSLNLAQTTLQQAFLPVSLSATLNGEIVLDVDMNEFQKSDGNIELNISKLNLPAQSVMGFNLPKIGIAESKIDLSISQGQLLIRSFELGKDIKQDDLVAKVTGEGSLDRNLMNSRLNAKAELQLSRTVIDSFPLLENLMGPAKTPDGKFRYKLLGPLMSLEARPGG